MSAEQSYIVIDFEAAVKLRESVHLVRQACSGMIVALDDFYGKTLRRGVGVTLDHAINAIEQQLGRLEIEDTEIRGREAVSKLRDLSAQFQKVLSGVPAPPLAAAGNRVAMTLADLLELVDLYGHVTSRPPPEPHRSMTLEEFEAQIAKDLEVQAPQDLIDAEKEAGSRPVDHDDRQPSAQAAAAAQASVLIINLPADSEPASSPLSRPSEKQKADTDSGPVARENAALAPSNPKAGAESAGPTIGEDARQEGEPGSELKEPIAPSQLVGDGPRLVALTKQEVRELLKQYGIPVESTDQASRWCKDHGLRQFDRREWEEKFSTKPPAKPGNPRYFEAAGLMKALIQHQAHLENAEETIAAREEQKQQIKGSRTKHDASP